MKKPYKEKLNFFDYFLKSFFRPGKLGFHCLRRELQFPGNLCHGKPFDSA